MRFLRHILSVIIFITGLTVISILVRNSLAADQVRREWASPAFGKLEEIGSTHRLEILPLLDEAAPTASGFQIEHGVSYLVRTDQAVVLLDMAQNARPASPSPLEANMAALGIDLKGIDAFVLSHNHPDHTGGLQWWSRGTFSLGNEQVALPFQAAYVPMQLSYPGLQPVVAGQPVKIAPGVATTGTIGFAEVFPASILRGKGAEQVLAVHVEGKGIVLITGCGHPGVEHILERAGQVFDEPVIGLIGGLHYTNDTAASVQPEIRYLQQNGLNLIGLSPHDSSQAAIQAFRDAFGPAYREVEVGTSILIGE